MNIRKFYLLTLVLLFFQGCSTLKPQITADAIDFNRAVEQTNNEVIFLNIIRSYLRFPRHYTAISDIKGNFTVTGNTGLKSNLNLEGASESTFVTSATPSITHKISSAAESISPELGVSYSTNPNYTIAVLESQEFYNGVLRPLSPTTVSLFRSQGWDEELLAHLLFEFLVFTITEKIDEDTDEDGKKKEPRQTILKFQNKSEEKGWRDLTERLRIDVESNLAEEKILMTTSSLDASGLAKLIEQGISVRRCGKEDQESMKCTSDEESIVYLSGTSSVGLNIYRKGKLSASDIKYYKDSIVSGDEELLNLYLTECPTELSSFIHRFSEDFTPSVGREILPRQEIADGDQLSLREQVENCPVVSSLQVSTRSVDAVVYYLGEYLRNARGKITIGVDNDQMFPVHFNDGPSAISTQFQGVTYRVPPGNESGRAMQVIALIQQLLNLNKKSEDLPKAQLIQIQ